MTTHLLNPDLGQGSGLDSRGPSTSDLVKWTHIAESLYAKTSNDPERSIQLATDPDHKIVSGMNLGSLTGSDNPAGLVGLARPLSLIRPRGGPHHIDAAARCAALLEFARNRYLRILFAEPENGPKGGFHTRVFSDFPSSVIVYNMQSVDATRKLQRPWDEFLQAFSAGEHINDAETAIDSTGDHEDSPELVHRRTLLFNELYSDFAAEPFEDGMNHAAEETIARAFRNTGAECLLGWMREFCTDIDRPHISASVLRCLSRLTEVGTLQWRKELLNDALAIDNVEIRDAAVQAIEQWEQVELLDLLRSHEETDPWLRDYIESVIDDFGE